MNRTTLTSYMDYRESGLPWLGKIPDHWKLMPNRGLVRKRKVLVGNRHSEYRLLSLTKQGVIIRDVSMGKGKFSADMGTSQVVRNGDLVFCLFDVPETPRTVGLSRHDGMITGAYTVFESLGSGNREYFELFYRAMDDRKLLSPLYSGLRNTIPTDRFLGTKTPHPPPEEQAAIVLYLDWACGRLDRAIRAKRKVIALLNEQRQAVIHRAVTRGLSACAPLMPSGTPWLGDIPVGWAVLRAKYLFREIDERSSTGSEELLSVSHLTGVTPRSQKNITMFKAESYVGHKLCRPGDLVINTMWAWMGALGISKDTGIISPAYAVYRQRGETSLSQGFIDALLRTRLYVDEFTRRSTGIRSSRLRMYPEEFFKVEILVPPRPEQEEIVSFISTHTANLNVAIERVSGEVDLLREYRTRLIADVVTGKLDVREAAMRLPVEETPMEEDLFSDGEIPDDEVMEQEG